MTTTARATRRFVILNPAAGSFTAEAVQAALARHVACAEGSCDVHEITKTDKVEEVARAAVGRGCDVVVAAGGDGTVSAVANALVGTDAALGILPLGTANVLARELGIPVALDAACALLAGPNATTRIDALKIGDRVFFTQVGVGLDALMIRDTDKASKKRFGRAAYLWTGLTRLLGFQPRRFSLSIDGTKLRPRAAQVLVANCGTLGQPPFRWGPGIAPDDGRADVCVVRHPTTLHFVGVAWSFFRGRPQDHPYVDLLPATQAIAIATDRPLPVQADGEIVGETPVEVGVLPGAVAVIVPPDRPRPGADG